MFKKTISVAFLVMSMCAFTACAQKQDIELEEYPIQQYSENESVDEQEDANADRTAEFTNEEKNEKGDDLEKEERLSELKTMFGEACIAEQTFETELSEYDGKVYVVPYAPTAEEPEFYIDIVQDGEAVESLWEYKPEELFGENFTSLDAIAFFDINFDDYTDIILVETYGDTTFVAAYMGFAKDADEYDRHFYADAVFSENITEQLDTLTIPAIREYVTKGKTNGEFTSYQDAYLARTFLCRLENDGEPEYDLIYFNEDNIPELVVSTGAFVSMYTYKEGCLYTLMDHWAYGAMGNAGYEYSPKKNSLRNYNTDFAGALLYTTYMSVNEQMNLETVVGIETFNFDDVNGNGMPDEEEENSVGNYSISYIEGVEVSDEECATYDKGDYEYILGSMSYDEILQMLKE